MKIVAQDRPVGVSRHRAERLRHAHPKMASRRRSTRVSPTSVHSPLGVGAPHAAPLRLLGFSMNLEVRIPRSEILDDRATRYSF